ncbi:Histone family protein DNA-binding protein [uncultured Paludibacter sp.]|uniref:Histone family protein DNA-binding protein n=1 Tax=uncultured Paludibacter sp. TaxID=497635 RepID=A0A653AB66_9BACT|nr:Histone family protein DNA-binding protein [uncultured Paludibacter sp.]
MNNKELISTLSSKLNLSKEDVDGLMQTFIDCCKEQLESDNIVGFQSFGTFEVRKKDERISVHPVTQVRTLIPPKLVVSFKQSSVLKEKLNTESQS